MAVICNGETCTALFFLPGFAGKVQVHWTLHLQHKNLILALTGDLSKGDNWRFISHYIAQTIFSYGLFTQRQSEYLRRGNILGIFACNRVTVLSTRRQANNVRLFALFALRKFASGDRNKSWQIHFWPYINIKSNINSKWLSKTQRY